MFHLDERVPFFTLVVQPKFLAFKPFLFNCLLIFIDYIVIFMTIKTGRNGRFFVCYSEFYIPIFYLGLIVNSRVIIKSLSL